MWGALVGAVIVLLFSYLSWRRQELQLEQIAIERERLLAFERRHLLLRGMRHHASDLTGSTSGSGSGHTSTPSEAPAEQHPSTPAAATAAGVGAAGTPPSTLAAASAESEGTHSSASMLTPRRKTELKMIEEFLCTVRSTRNSGLVVAGWCRALLMAYCWCLRLPLPLAGGVP